MAFRSTQPPGDAITMPQMRWHRDRGLSAVRSNARTRQRATGDGPQVRLCSPGTAARDRTTVQGIMIRDTRPSQQLLYTRLCRMFEPDREARDGPIGRARQRESSDTCEELRPQQE